MFNWPKTLLRGLAYDNLTIFFGAGIPCEFNLPLWNELVDKLFEEMKSSLSAEEQAEFKDFVKVKDYLNAIELLMYKNEEIVLDCLENAFNKDDFDSFNLEESNENLLFKLNANSYLTTNIDNSLEEIKGLSGKKAASIYSYKNEKDIRDKLIFHNSEKDPLIIRVHGELKDVSSLIFSQSQYSKLNKEDFFIFNQLIPSLFLVSTVLIVGYSISDPDIQLILEKTAKIKGTKDNIFFINADGKLSKHKKRMFTNQFGIKILDIYTDLDTTYDITHMLKKRLNELIDLKDILLGYSLNDKRKLFKNGQQSIYDELKQTLDESKIPVLS